MKKIVLAILGVIIISFPIFLAEAYVSVKGYYRKDGTYVKPHVRSNPNGLKYDNYGYKPSQGLYNDSYGTRGSSWDTPTYITDPDYYKGKSLYDSGEFNTNYNYNRSYTAPTYSRTTDCPSNAYYSQVSSSCKCLSGYKASTDKSYCIKKNTSNTCADSINGYYDVSEDACYCNAGYQWSDTLSRCYKKPLEPERLTTETSCIDRYLSDKTTFNWAYKLLINGVEVSSVPTVYQKSILNYLQCKD